MVQVISAAEFQTEPAVVGREDAAAAADPTAGMAPQVWQHIASSTGPIVPVLASISWVTHFMYEYLLQGPSTQRSTRQRGLSLSVRLAAAMVMGLTGRTLSERCRTMHRRL